MKNTFFILVSGLLISFSSQAQKKKAAPVKEVAVPENVTTSFKTVFTVANDNKWSKNYSGNYVATFTNADNLKETAEFSNSGAMVKSKIEYKADALPEHLNTSVSTQYPNAKVAEAAKLQMPGVAPYYKVKIIDSDNTSKELLVSEEGTITE